MDFFRGTDAHLPQDRVSTTVGLRAHDVSAHEYAKPLFDAGVCDVFLTRRTVYTRAQGDLAPDHSMTSTTSRFSARSHSPDWENCRKR